MIDIPTVSILATSAGILVALVYYAFMLRHQNRLRQTDIVMRLNSDWVGWEIEKGVNELMRIRKKFKDYDEYRKAYPAWERTDRPEILAMSRVAKFFEVAGILAHRKLVDIDMINEMFGIDVKIAWEAYRPVLEGVRKEMNVPTFRKNYEYLYNEVKKREQQLASQAA